MNLRVRTAVILTFVAIGSGGAHAAAAAEEAQRRDPICIGTIGPVIVRVCTPT